MAEFRRNLGTLVDKLKAEPLFTSHLKIDIEKGDVFFAIRPDGGSFYYKGRNLFKYGVRGFSTYLKFAFVPSVKKETYMTEDEVKNVTVADFCDGYERIKERASRYLSQESKGVSKLYKFAPHIWNTESRYFLVDIESVFDAKNDNENNATDRKTDRIDMLLYDNKNQKLLFCEAKHFSNNEIRSKDGNTPPEVVAQLEKYNRQIAANRENILSQYAIAFEEYNKLMGTDLKPPVDIHPHCGLFIFGFNRIQQKELQGWIDEGKFRGHKCRKIGGVGNEDICNLYAELK